MSSTAALLGYSGVRKRATRACGHCRSRKVRCEVLSRPPCVRCRIEGLACALVRRGSSAVDSTHRPAVDTTPAPSASTHPLFDSIWDPMPTASWGTDSQNAWLINDLDIDYDLPPDADSHQASAPLEPGITDPGGEPPEPESLSPEPSSAPIGLCDVSHLSADDLKHLASRHVFTLPPKPIQDALVKAYFLFIHPGMPILSEDLFWSEYDHGLPHTSFLLYRAMLFAACPFVVDGSIQAWAQMSLSAAQKGLYLSTRLLYDSETEADKYALIQAALLLSFWSNAGLQNHRRDRYWLSVAHVMSRELAAQYQQSPDSLQQPRLVKRLLWCYCIRDSALALGYRGALPLEPKCFDIPALNLQDLDDPLSYSRVWNRESKSLLAHMAVSLAKLASLSNHVDSAWPARTCATPPLSEAASSQCLSLLLVEVEKRSLDMAAWRKEFTEKFGDLSSISNFPEYRAILLHRNILLMIQAAFIILLNQPRPRYYLDPREHTGWATAGIWAAWDRAELAAEELATLAKELMSNSLDQFFPLIVCPIMATSYITRTLYRLFGPGRNKVNNAEDVTTKVLESLKGRFPAVEELIVLLQETTRFAEQISLEGNGPEAAAGDTSVPFYYDHDSSPAENESLFTEGTAICRAISFLDQTFPRGAHDSARV